MSLRQLSLGLACVLAFALLAQGASAQNWRKYNLGGNARFQIGDGLPIPIGGSPAPNGRVAADANATALQTGGKPAKLQIRPHQLHAPGNAINLPVFLNNSNVFQVKTAIPLAWPANEANFVENGRTGGPTETFCPGSVSPPFNCASGSAGTIAGLMRYMKTANQFGGPARGNAGGSADVGIRAGAGAPCSFLATPGCNVIFALATPQPTGAQGATFGVVISTLGGAPPAPGGLRQARITAAGHITYVTSPGLGTGLPNPATSYGGPWTTGQLKVSQPAAVGTAELFTMTGSDGRDSSGSGSISLVSGSVSDRTLTGPNANRGWLNLTLTPFGPGLPTLSTGGIALLVSLIAGAGLWVVRRNRV